MKRILFKWWWNFHANHLQERKLKFVDKFFNKHLDKYCWADCVAWSYSPERFNPFKIDNACGCKTESIEHPTNLCYCGGWCGGVCFHTLLESEKEQYKHEQELVSLTNDLPF